MNTNILKVLRIFKKYGEIISCFTSNIDEVHVHFNGVNANRATLLKITESVSMEFLSKVEFVQVLNKLGVSSKSAPTSLPSFENLLSKGFVFNVQHEPID